MGRFRNLIQTTVVPTKRLRMDNIGIPTATSSSSSADMIKHLHPPLFIPNLYHDLPPTSTANDTKTSIQPNYNTTTNELEITSMGIGSKLGLLLPNPAPEVTPNNETMPPNTMFGMTTKGAVILNYSIVFHITYNKIYFLFSFTIKNGRSNGLR